MKRFRLRFLLQELELSGPEVVIGRSPTCNITLEDPLVSRRHAIIRMEQDVAVLVDLGSRNGMKINGHPAPKEYALKDGDRIRIGTQDIVFSMSDTRGAAAKPTGFMRLCESCHAAYPDGVTVCPHCGVATQPDDETASGAQIGPRKTWALQLLGEIVERALNAQKPEEAERVMRRVVEEVDERFKAGERLDASNIHTIALYAIKLAHLKKDLAWIKWSLDLYTVNDAEPNAAVRAELRSIYTDAPDLGDEATRDRIGTLISQAIVSQAP